MIKCSCGRKFANEKEWRQHYLIIQPSITVKNYEQDLKLREEHDIKHRRVK